MENSSQPNSGESNYPADEDIDYSDIPPRDDRFFANATLRIPAAQAKTIVQLDPDVFEWFESKGSGYRKMINDTLRNYIAAH